MKLSAQAFRWVAERPEVDPGILQNADLAVGAVEGSSTGLAETRAFCTFLNSSSSSERFRVVSLSLKFAVEVETKDSANLFFSLNASPKSIFLRELSLAGSALDERSFKVLLDNLKSVNLANLCELSLAHNHGGYFGARKAVKMLNDPSYLPALTSLSVADNEAKVAVLEYLDMRLAQRRPFLRTLDLGGNSLDLAHSDVNGYLTANQHFLSIEHLLGLDLSWNILYDDRAVALFRTVLPLGPIERAVEMRHEHEDGSPKAHAFPLESLTLRGCELANDFVAYLTELISADKLANLKVLQLGSNRISIVGVQMLLAPLQRRHVSKLEVLGLSLNPLRDQGLIAVANGIVLGSYDSLHTLETADVGAGRNNMVNLVKMLCDRHTQDPNLMPNFRHVEVYGNQPTLGRKFVKPPFPNAFVQKVIVT